MKRRGIMVMPYFRRQGRQLTKKQRIKNLRIAIERVHVGKYYISSSKSKLGLTGNSLAWVHEPVDH